MSLRDVSEFDTLDDLKADIKRKMEEKKRKKMLMSRLRMIWWMLLLPI